MSKRTEVTETDEQLDMEVPDYTVTLTVTNETTGWTVTRTMEAIDSAAYGVRVVSDMMFDALKEEI